MTMELVHPELALAALIVLLGVTLIALSLISMWKESRHGQPLKGIVWFALAIVAFYAVIALFAGYVQKAGVLEKVFHRMEAVIW